MYWILQTNKNNYLDKWIHAFDVNGSKYKTIEIVPLAKSVPELDVNDLAVVIGTTTLMKYSKPNWIPGTFFNPENFRVSTWLDVYKNELLNSDGQICKLKNVMENTIGEESFFIRPNDDLKNFSGVVVKRDSFQNQIDNIDQNPDNFIFDTNLDVFVSPIRHIQKEFRFFIVDKKVVTGCQYRLKSMMLLDSNIDQSVIDYAQKLVNIWQPADAYVMDVALNDNNEYKLLEFNCINASGLYVCDAVKIVKAIEDMVDSPDFLTKLIYNKVEKIKEIQLKSSSLINEISEFLVDKKNEVK